MSELERPSTPSDSTNASRTARKPYAPPRLVEYGSVAKLTRTQGSTSPEPHGFMRPCL